MKDFTITMVRDLIYAMLSVWCDPSRQDKEKITMLRSYMARIDYELDSEEIRQR